MNGAKSADPRTEVLLSLLPPGVVFRRTYGGDSLWCPNSRGYVNERDPLRAGLYSPDDHYAPWSPVGEHPNEHSFTIDAAETLRGYKVQDDTTLALLIDEVLQLRVRVTELDAEVTRQIKRAVDGRPIALMDAETQRIYGPTNPDRRDCEDEC